MRLRLTTALAAPIERCFDLSCSIDLHAESMQASKERAVAGVTSGIGLGEEVTWEARHFGVTWRVTSRITEYERPRRFVDEMQAGPLRGFRHEHCFEEHDSVTTMVDVVDYRLPLGPLGRLVDALAFRRYLHRLLLTRNAFIKAAAEEKPDFTDAWGPAEDWSDWQ